MRLLGAIEPSPRDTLVIVAGDHGEAFGEHGEFSHSIFIYDTTLRVPLVMRGPGISSGEPTTNRERTANAMVTDPVTLADVAPTAMRLLGFTMPDADGIDLSPALAGASAAAARALRRVVRAAHGVWLGAAARDPVGTVEVHRGAETRALRHRERRLRADQRRRTRKRPWLAISTRARTGIRRRDCRRRPRSTPADGSACARWAMPWVRDSTTSPGASIRRIGATSRPESRR